MKNAKTLIAIVFITLITVGCRNAGTNFLATASNQNVYKTKTPLKLKRVYEIEPGTPIVDETTYILTPRGKYKFLRYKVVNDEKISYIRILPGVRFNPLVPAGNYEIIGDVTTLPVTLEPTKTTIVITATSSGTTTETTTVAPSATTTVKTVVLPIPGTTAITTTTTTTSTNAPSTPLGRNPYSYYFQMVDEPTPNNHYLATQAITGMPIVLPFKLREKVKGVTSRIELGLSLGYAFGFKIKLGNNPYRKDYINIIPLAVSLNKDSYVYHKTADTLSEGIESVSLTYYSFGVTYELYGVNFGAFMGWDRMFDTPHRWIHQDRPWVSVGIGYKIGKAD